MIIPGIFEDNQEGVLKLLTMLAGVAKVVQLDIADGLFVPRKTFTDLGFLSGHNPQTTIQLHLMVQKPEAYSMFLPKEITDVCAHAESFIYRPLCLGEYYDLLKSKGKRRGICFNPDTGFEEFAQVIKQCDYVQLMSVYPGDQGKAFLASTLTKVRGFKKSFPDTPIQLDGGIALDNVQTAVEVGANSLVVGSKIAKSPDPVKAYTEFVLKFDHARRDFYTSSQPNLHH